MIATAFFFYLFAAVAVASAIMVITSRNPVHSVLYLILCFFNGAGLFILLGAEFLAMILVVVYVGAVMVLFLFVVMMLDIDYAELRQGMLNYLPVGATIGFILLVELILALGAWAILPNAGSVVAAPVPPVVKVTNTEALGQIIYTKYVYFFQAAGVILLVAMVGAIVLTLRHKPGVKRQDIAAQVARRPATAMEIRKVEPGQGI
ncbi:MAG TPA: NADH-quinone oxidoreductase subunit J [Aestuariivirgaceae bacterium]|jgi:NADH-quinone oxidoreductase subunit J